MPTTRQATTRTFPSIDELPRAPRREPPELPAPPGSAVRAHRPAATATGSARTRRSLFTGRENTSGSLNPFRATNSPSLRRDPLLALVTRITQGFSLAEYERARALGYDAYLEEQLDHLSIDDSAMDSRLANFPTLDMSPKDLVDTYGMNVEIPLQELKGAALVRAVHSKRQLFERMCEFWTDHFNIDHQKEIEWAMKSEDDRDVVRRHALGTFPELLSASAHSGAMMFYLDNWLNWAGAPQENYARELMELHTLGVDGGYTEKDVKEVAKCFTGWSIETDEDSPEFLRFKFIDGLHQIGWKVVLGRGIPPLSFQTGGETVLDLLAHHASTARFVTGKLVRWLLTETPSQALLDEAAGEFLDTGGDIKSVLRVILAEKNVRAIASESAPKFKRPFHFVTSLLRGLEVDVYDPYATLYYLYFMGHSPFDWPAPTGYPDTEELWGRSLLPRWTFTSHLLAGYVPGVQVALGEVLALLGDLNGPGLAARINARVLGGALSPEDVASVEAFLDPRRPLIWPEVYEAIGLAASTPGFNRF